MSRQRQQWADRARRPTAGRRRLELVGIGLLWLLALGVVGGWAAWFLWPRPTVVAAATMPLRPAQWSGTLQLGYSSGRDGAAEMRKTAAFGFRYQYLAGGVNTGNGWATWNPDGSFVTDYIDDSYRNEIVPVFTYYMLTQSAPGLGNGPSEAAAVQANASNRATMQAYFQDLRLFFQRAGAFPDRTVVLHVEPDLWGFLHQRAGTDDAARIPVIVGGSGLPDLADLPDTLSGFAQAIVRLRDREGPNVLLGYHVSSWGTGTDLYLQNVGDGAVDAVARR